MFAETLAATTPNTRTTNMNNTSKPPSPNGMSGPDAATRDLSAHEWSRAVIDELQHIRVGTPRIKDIIPTRLSENMGNKTNMQASRPGQCAQKPTEPAQKQLGYDQRSTSQLEESQRPQVVTIESTATIDIVKRIPGGW
ncbi:hypothetical protein TWF481_006460 [Arthrobotrys musiformis]|uniref:Uncharacterized protein n=1 Tax=Arthrobotrys musiformis TaxID=47236 RepID=A0AAV9WIR2_9PEZI